MLHRHLLLALTALTLGLAGPAPALAHHVPGDDPPTADPYADEPWAQAPVVEEDISDAGQPAVEPAPTPELAPPPTLLPPRAPRAPRPTPVPLPAPEPAGPPLVTSATVPGRMAMLRTDGRAAIPRGVPKRIRAVIAAANQIVGRPYKWGGGHAKLNDRGYDCSGTVSYALIRAGMLQAPQVSGSLARWSAPGAGRWLTVYANRGHVYLEVAGLRLDTSGVGDPRGGSGPRWRPVIGARPRFAARHVLGL